MNRSSDEHTDSTSPQLVAEAAEQSRLFINNRGAYSILEKLQEAILITNHARRIVYANPAALALASAAEMDEIIGLLPGRAFQCIHAMGGENVCGNTKFCEKCGSLFAFQNAETGIPTVRDFTITRYAGKQIESLDLKVSSSRLPLNESLFFLFSLINVSHEKRRTALERTFFHDILNTAGGIQGLIDMLRQNPSDNPGELLDMLKTGIDYLVREIESQRILAAAERKELSVGPQAIHSLELLRDTVRLYEYLPSGEGRPIFIDANAEDVFFISDPDIIRRVLGNMLKNAQEAARAGDAIRAGCRGDTDESVRFWVFNPTALSLDIQLQIFQRSFSTKGSGRGLGTYGMKLLTEQYLSGEVGFHSDAGGTTFWARYPKVLKPAGR